MSKIVFALFTLCVLAESGICATLKPTLQPLISNSTATTTSDIKNQTTGSALNTTEKTTSSGNVSISKENELNATKDPFSWVPEEFPYEKATNFQENNSTTTKDPFSWVPDEFPHEKAINFQENTSTTTKDPFKWAPESFPYENATTDAKKEEVTTKDPFHWAPDVFPSESDPNFKFNKDDSEVKDMLKLSNDTSASPKEESKASSKMVSAEVPEATTDPFHWAPEVFPSEDDPQAIFAKDNSETKDLLQALHSHSETAKVGETFKDVIEENHFSSNLLSEDDSQVELIEDVKDVDSTEIVMEQKMPAAYDEEEAYMQGQTAVTIACIFAVLAVVAYIGLLAWRRWLEKRYGNRELLCEEDDDLKHFSI